MSLSRYAKPLAIASLIAALAIVVVQNRAPVQTHLWLITVEMPQILLLVLAALAGFVAGLLLPALLRPKRTWPRPPARPEPAGEESPA